MLINYYVGFKALQEYLYNYMYDLPWKTIVITKKGYYEERDPQSGARLLSFHLIPNYKRHSASIVDLNLQYFPYPTIYTKDIKHTRIWFTDHRIPH